MVKMESLRHQAWNEDEDLGDEGAEKDEESEEEDDSDKVDGPKEEVKEEEWYKGYDDSDFEIDEEKEIFVFEHNEEQIWLARLRRK